MHLFENLPVGRVEGTFLYNGIWRFYGYIYDGRKWGNIIAYHYNAEKHVLTRDNNNYSYWVENVKLILDGQKNLTTAQTLFSNNLTTSNKQIVGSESKNIYLGNTDLEEIYFQFAGKTVSLSSLLNK